MTTPVAVRIWLPTHLRRLCRLPSAVVDVTLAARAAPVTLADALDALERAYPALRGTIRDYPPQGADGVGALRPFLRCFAGQVDLTPAGLHAPLPEAVVAGGEVLRIVGAIAGGRAVGPGATRRLFCDDAYRRTAEGTVLAVRTGDRPAVALDATIFFPAGGGQPCDLGTLGGASVVDVREDDGVIWHALDPAFAPPAVGARVAQELDWPRRFDHMQQHTGQHILSQAFLRVLGARTLAVHMGASCTLDVDVPAPAPEAFARVEELANAVVFENRPVLVRAVEPAEADLLGLRRPPRQAGRLRIVEVAEFDRSACGGTHVQATGEVGVVLLRGWERYKGGTRVEFACGARAVRDARAMRRLLREAALPLSVGAHELPEAVARLRERAHDLEKQLVRARERLLELEAEVLLEAARPGGAAGAASPALVTAVFAARPMEEVRALARAVTQRGPAVALFAVDHGRRLVVARSPGLRADAAAILRVALARFGGRGGGTPEAAEGAATQAPTAQALVDAAAEVAREVAG